MQNSIRPTTLQKTWKRPFAGDMDKTSTRSARIKAITASLLAGAAIMAAKFFAYHLTGSSAVLSDALESIINVVASAFALLSIIISARPPDRTHPYGHGKIEYFSAGFEGALIMLAAIGIFKVGISHLLNPVELPAIDLGLLVLAAAGMANLILGASLLKAGRKTNSLAIIADGRHVLTDVYSTAGVIVGLVVVRLTGMLWLDGAVACLMGAYISIAGASLVKKSFSALMDASDERLLERISEILKEHRKDLWIGIHQLRAWRAGEIIHIDLHLILPRNMTLEAAHAEAKELEALLVERFEGRASVLIHTDPCVDPDCPVCRQYSCAIRAKEFRAETLWHKETLVLKGGTGESR